MKKTINGYQIISGTAVAINIDETEPQLALYIHKKDDINRDGDCVVFGYEMPENDDDLKNIFEDYNALTTYWETLYTFIPDEEKEIKAIKWVFWGGDDNNQEVNPFEKKSEALKYGKYVWEHTTEKEKRELEVFMVALCKVEKDSFDTWCLDGDPIVIEKDWLDDIEETEE